MKISMHVSLARLASLGQKNRITSDQSSHFGGRDGGQGILRHTVTERRDGAY